MAKPRKMEATLRSKGMEGLVIAVDNPRAADVRELLERHLAFAHEHSPPEDVHALNHEGLVDPAITFFAGRRDRQLLAIGALKQLDETHGELKSMHTAVVARGQGIGRAMLDHLLAVARQRGYRRVSLETGSMDAFRPARALYTRAGFSPCGPFGDYPDSPNSMCMTLLVGADQKPPRLDAGERETLHALLQYQRDSFVRKVHGVDDGTARRALVGSGTSLLWLTKHLARAEQVWVLHRFAGLASDLPRDEVHSDDTIAGAIDGYRATWALVDDVVAAANLDEPCRRASPEAPVNLRWVLMHLLEETARHAGHADILRELIDGTTGR